MNDLHLLWNDFHSAFSGTVPDTEEALTGVLADAIRAVTPELPDGFYFGGAAPDGRYLEVELHKQGNTVEKLLLAVCNKSPKGGGLGKQLIDLEKRRGDFPAALVRTTEFPPPRGSVVAGQIAKLLKCGGRTVVVADADQRRMQAFEAFRSQYGKRPDFAAWQKAARPLGELNALQKILRLNTLAAAPGSTAIPGPSSAPPTSPGIPAPATPPPVAPPLRAALVFGRTLGLVAAPVQFQADEFVQHAAFLGGTGSGKTTAALNLIEQLLARDVPAVLIDRKGDLCRYAEPSRLGTPTRRPRAHRGAAGIAGQARRGRVHSRRAEGPTARLAGRAARVRPAAEADRERFAQYAAAALGSMIGFKTSDADKGQRAILAKAIETLAAVPGATITVPALRDVIEQQDDALLNAIGGGYPDNYYTNLGPAPPHAWN